MRPGRRSRPSDLRPAGPSAADALLARVASGDEKAAAELYHRSAPALSALLARILPDRTEAAQALDEVWGGLRRAAPSLLREGASVSAWLVLAARAAGVRRLRAARELPDRESRSNKVLAAAPFCLPRPADIERLEERRELLSKVFRQLPPRQVQALELTLFEGLTAGEIAQRLNEPLGKVEADLCAALKFLRHRLRAVTGLWVANI